MLLKREINKDAKGSEFLLLYLKIEHNSKIRSLVQIDFLTILIKLNDKDSI